MAGMDLPLRAIREQIASAVDLIVQISRLRDGTRRITHVTEVQGMEGDIVTLQDVFVFDYSAGVDLNGRFLGKPVPTGIRRPPIISRSWGLYQPRDLRTPAHADGEAMTVPGQLVFVFGIVAITAAVLIAMVVVFKPAGGSVPMERRRPFGNPDQGLLTRITEATVKFVEQSLSRRTPATSQSTSLLVQAGLTLPRADFLVLAAAGTLVSAVVGFILQGGRHGPPVRHPGSRPGKGLPVGAGLASQEPVRRTAHEQPGP